MNYYEELGIPRDADPDDIHEAYKLAAQLLHPDKQIEPRLKAMAERQMKRLSVIAAVLTNPSDRLAYDATLTTRTLPVAQPPSGAVGRITDLAGGGAAVVLGAPSVDDGRHGRLVHFGAELGSKPIRRDRTCKGSVRDRLRAE